jgi:NTE family protein
MQLKFQLHFVLEANKRDVDLNINLRESDKTYLKFGLHYDNLFKSAVLWIWRVKKSNFKNDVASFDILF